MNTDLTWSVFALTRRTAFAGLGAGGLAPILSGVLLVRLFRVPGADARVR